MSTIPEMDEFVHLIEDIAYTYQAQHVAAITIKLGALCHISPTYFRQHFIESAEHTLAEGAELIFFTGEDETERYASDVTLVALEVE